MSRSSADYVREEPPAQTLDLVGLVAGVLFTFAGLAYLIGGNHALSGKSSLVLPTLLVLLGVAGVAGSGLLRRSWFSQSSQPVTAETGSPADDVEGASPEA